MKKVVTLFVFCVVIVTHAAGDYSAGEKKSQTCAACHGAKGMSTNPDWPSLAGQQADYLIKQLRDFTKGSRPSAVMTPLAAALSEQDRQDLAEFYSKQPIPSQRVPERFVTNGEVLYRGGDFDKHITACIACHGPSAMGNEQAGFPMLSGQQPKYIIGQLELFRNKKRYNDLNSIMQDISARMSPEDMEAVAYFSAGLHGSEEKR